MGISLLGIYESPSEPTFRIFCHIPSIVSPFAWFNVKTYYLFSKAFNMRPYFLLSSAIARWCLCLCCWETASTTAFSSLPRYTSSSVFVGGTFQYDPAARINSNIKSFLSSQKVFTSLKNKIHDDDDYEQSDRKDKKQKEAMPKLNEETKRG